MTTTPQAGHYTVLKGELVWVGPTRFETITLTRALDEMAHALDQPRPLDDIRRILRQYRQFRTPTPTKVEL